MVFDIKYQSGIELQTLKQNLKQQVKMQVILFGCGALGSNLAVEISKRADSSGTDLTLVLVDYDKVELRNLAAQAFQPKHLDMYKVDAVADLVDSYQYVRVTKINNKLTEDNLTNFLEINPNDFYIGIDCFDNLEARRLSWKFGLVNNIPIIHAGMSEKGSGVVSWSYKNYDSFPYSSKNISPTKFKEVLEASESLESLPPCELNGFRPLVMNTVFATLEALFIFIGRDISRTIGDDTRKPGLITNWVSNNKGYSLNKSLNYQIEEF